MNKLFVAMTAGLFALLTVFIAEAGVAVTDTVLSKEKQESAGQVQKKADKKSSERTGGASASAASGAKAKK